MKTNACGIVQPRTVTKHSGNTSTQMMHTTTPATPYPVVRQLSGTRERRHGVEMRPLHLLLLRLRQHESMKITELVPGAEEQTTNRHVTPKNTNIYNNLCSVTSTKQVDSATIGRKKKHLKILTISTIYKTNGRKNKALAIKESDRKPKEHTCNNSGKQTPDSIPQCQSWSLTMSYAVGPSVIGMVATMATQSTKR